MTTRSSKVGKSGWLYESWALTVQGLVTGGALLGIVSGCGASNRQSPPAEPASSMEETSALSERTADDADVGEGPGPAEAEEASESGSNEAASSDDFRQALQVVIQDESLLNELKLGEPGRFPLKISGGSLPSGLQLQAHSEAVQVVSAPADPKKEPVLVFTNIDINARHGTFKYRYDIEGVRGTSHVMKNSMGVWELKSSRVSEY